MNYEFANLEELTEALDGEWGEEAQAAAEQVAAQFDQEIESEAAEVEQQRFSDHFAQEVVRLEQRQGRELTEGELDVLQDDAERSTPGTPIDLDESYGRLIGREKGNDDDEHDVMVEAFEEHQAQPDPDEAEVEPEAEDEYIAPPAESQV